LEHNQPQHVRPDASVIAQQYPSANIVSLPLLSNKKNFGGCFNNVSSSSSIFFLF
jgi:hypothetical protein